MLAVRRVLAVPTNRQHLNNCLHLIPSLRNNGKKPCPCDSKPKSALPQEPPGPAANMRSQMTLPARVGQAYRTMLASNEYALAKKYTRSAMVYGAVAVRKSLQLMRQYGPVYVRHARKCARDALEIARNQGPVYAKKTQAALEKSYGRLRKKVQGGGKEQPSKHKQDSDSNSQ